MQIEPAGTPLGSAGAAPACVDSNTPHAGASAGSVDCALRLPGVLEGPEGGSPGGSAVDRLPSRDWVDESGAAAGGCGPATLADVGRAPLRQAIRRG